MTMVMATRTQVKPLSMRAEIGAIDVEKRTFEVVWTTGAKVLRSSWYDGSYYEELSLDPAHVRMGRLTSGRSPFLGDHNSYAVARTLGVIESARLEKGRGVALVRFAKEGIDPEADKVFAKIADRIINNVSVGYRTFKVEKIESKEEKVSTLRAIDWEPHEISAVTIGADADAFVRTFENEPTNDLEVIDVSPLGAPSTTNERAAMEPKELEAQRQAEIAKREAEQKALVERAQQDERERIAGIQSAVRAAGLEETHATRMINDNTGLDAARKFVLDELGKREEKAPIVNQRVELGDTDDDKFQRMAIALLLTRAGAEAGGAVAEAAAKKVKGFDNISLDAGDLRGLSMVELARETLRRKGVSTRGLDRNQMLALAFTQRSAVAYAGIADFPVLLENVMGKILLAAYATTPDTWSRICKVESVDDFRTSPRYRTGSLGVLERVGENGEFKNLAIPDGKKLTIQTDTKGKIIAITRQMIINDDMSAFADLTTKLGRSAKLSIEVDFYALLAQNGGLGPTVGGNPFFHASNGNVGTASALSVAGLDADRVLMAAQKDAEGNEFLDIRPEILLIPSGQFAAARVLNNSAYDHDNSKLQKPNAVQGLFRDIVETPRLTGNRRYTFANPNQVPAFVVAFLNGQQNPTIESKDGWRVDGAEMKVRIDYLVQPFDVKGALTNAGA